MHMYQQRAKAQLKNTSVKILDILKSVLNFNVQTDFIDAFYEYGENYVISFNGGYALISADGENSTPNLLPVHKYYIFP